MCGFEDDMSKTQRNGNDRTDLAEATAQCREDGLRAGRSGFDEQMAGEVSASRARTGNAARPANDRWNGGSGRVWRMRPARTSAWRLDSIAGRPAS